MDQRPVQLMIIAMALQACILPAVVIPILILVNQKQIMGKHASGKALNLGLVGVLIFSFVTTYFAIIDLIEYFSSSPIT